SRQSARLIALLRQNDQARPARGQSSEARHDYWDFARSVFHIASLPDRLFLVGVTDMPRPAASDRQPLQGPNTPTISGVIVICPFAVPQYRSCLGCPVGCAIELVQDE